MKSFSKIIIYTCVGLVSLVLVWWIGSSAYSGWKGYKWEKQTEEFQLALSKPYREDTYGGKTPEETWGMFLDALKKGDVELASKYFVPEKQEEWKKNITNTIKDDKLNLAIKNIENIKFDTSTKDTAYFIYTLKNKDSGADYINSVVFILNTYTKVWKISLL